jgi:two-component system sensor histidine kinase KdpD
MPLSVDDALHLIVHDLRNPLNVLLQNVRFVSDAVVDEDARAAAQDAISSGAAIERMLANVVDALCESSPLAGAVIEDVRLAPLCAAAAEQADPRVKLAPVLPSLTVQADDKILSRMLATLLDNALRHSQGRVDMSARLTPAKNRVVIRISDAGAAVPPEFLPLVFTPDARLHENAKRMRPEPCFGLVAAKLAAIRFGGTLEIEQPGLGNVFVLELPARG